MRVGTGWDLHRLVAGRPLIIGGVEIPHTHGPQAHSDGDVLIHALIDALLGALAAGDIGHLFPPSDEQWRDAPSLKLLALTLPHIEGYKIVNVDSTVILETPKLAPYIEKIRSSLATALGVSVERISVKAKTAEGLMPEAIAAQVAVLLSKN
ncbi:MAG: 2-C-methyl-D-erythritol 2,4-cyclodiphosphate synthase [Spirochaetales bacterium]|jgi:2-C-methyl-D-erythritol 2,4-cyclodiphosphate synthase|nr:2-C-methyl-D-erythritol 2,4-cyclodiphosphate synthase [Spirochaetales bacterium]